MCHTSPMIAYVPCPPPSFPGAIKLAPFFDPKFSFYESYCCFRRIAKFLLLLCRPPGLRTCLYSFIFFEDHAFFCLELPLGLHEGFWFMSLRSISRWSRPFTSTNGPVSSLVRMIAEFFSEGHDIGLDFFSLVVYRFTLLSSFPWPIVRNGSFADLVSYLPVHTLPWVSFLSSPSQVWGLFLFGSRSFPFSDFGKTPTEDLVFSMAFLLPVEHSPLQ